MTNLPDHFMNLVVCSQLPPEGVDDLVEGTLAHFRSMNIRKLSWLTHENVPAAEINKVLLDHGLIFRDAFATEMAVDLSLLPDGLPTHPGLRIVAVDGEHVLKQWIHVASIGFRVDESLRRFGLIFSQMRFLTGGFKPVWPCWMDNPLPRRNYSSLKVSRESITFHAFQMFVVRGLARQSHWLCCLRRARWDIELAFYRHPKGATTHTAAWDFKILAN